MQKLASVAFVLGVVAATSHGIPGADLSAATADEAVEKRGCCSHHGGVCGCSSGRTTCCDGQVSPTCNCVAPNASP